MLFLAFLLAAGSESAADLHDYAKDVVATEENALELKQDWKLDDSWKSIKGTAHIFDRVTMLYNSSWSGDELDTIGAAMRLWNGAGRHDDLTQVQLYAHIKQYNTGKLLSAEVSKKTAPPRRWRAWPIVKVAQFVKRNGAALRKALGLDGMEPDEVPTAIERLRESEARVVELKLQVEQKDEMIKEDRAAARKIQDAFRKAQSRNATKAKERAAAVKEAKAAVRKQLKKQLKERIEDAKERAKQAAKRKIDDITSVADANAEAAFTVRLATARQRARTVESQAKLAQSRLKEMKQAKSEASEYKRQLEEMRAALESDDDEASVPEGSSSSRRDKKGRFEAEPWQMRVLKWAQLGRRTPPSAVNANITEVLTVCEGGGGAAALREADAQDARRVHDRRRDDRRASRRPRYPHHLLRVRRVDQVGSRAALHQHADRAARCAGHIRRRCHAWRHAHGRRHR